GSVRATLSGVALPGFWRLLIIRSTLAFGVGGLVSSNALKSLPMLRVIRMTPARCVWVALLFALGCSSTEPSDPEPSPAADGGKQPDASPNGSGGEPDASPGESDSGADTSP